MPQELSIAHTRMRLPALVHEVEEGQPVRLGARRSDLWKAIESFRRQADLRALDVDEILAGVRDRSPGREG